jgi:hypothetical protein
MFMAFSFYTQKKDVSIITKESKSKSRRDERPHTVLICDLAALLLSALLRSRFWLALAPCLTSISIQGTR